MYMALLDNYILFKNKIETNKHLLSTIIYTSITNNWVNKFNGSDGFAYLFKLSSFSLVQTLVNNVTCT